MTRKYLYLLTVHDEETGERVTNLEAYTQESLQEQLHKVDGAIKEYEHEKLHEDELSDEQ